MMFWNQKKKEKAATGNEKKRFDHLLSVAEKLPVMTLPDLIRAIVRPVQSDFLLAVAEEGTDARPNMTPEKFFFEGLIHVKSYEKMKEHEMDGADYPLSLASDMVLPWPWSLQRFINNVSRIGNYKGKPWKQDNSNHYVELWLPWRIGFVGGGNHSITAGILAGEGTLIPEHVYDMSWLFELVRTDGNHWFVDNHKVEAVKSGRSAAVFEIGRLLVEGA
ncbi:TPA: hypothetical protein N2R33_005416 [Klebsiella pneumoniae]|uniref:Fip n=1 Tax=Pluralibacter gergoviae TaxID=61647 RepID=A0A142I4B5_PLUGE|nr:DUF6710 family protein [Klebsiella pneumoniae]AMR39480.1 hypothetical protein LG71_27445 [Pluralibacter gergoviae]MBQ4727653.1 hypothetical protein [Escherichia coli]MBX4816756.1 hypothetical protein [Klebsiella variicola]MBZ6759149.1 hypothetical protein [Klebsiella grimontii]HDS4417571.1 hypothetical protein [Klebsiella pneumoniae subsp. pneumoniae]